MPATPLPFPLARMPALRAHAVENQNHSGVCLTLPRPPSAHLGLVARRPGGMFGNSLSSAIHDACIRAGWADATGGDYDVLVAARSHATPRPARPDPTRDCLDPRWVVARSLRQVAHALLGPPGPAWPGPVWCGLPIGVGGRRVVALEAGRRHPTSTRCSPPCVAAQPGAASSWSDGLRVRASPASLRGSQPLSVAKSVERELEPSAAVR